MEKHWVVREGNPALILFALGWGSDPRAVAHIRPAGYDILCMYDYCDPEIISAEMLAGYPSITLFAWSFGVSISELLLGDIPFHKTIALNGTPRPVDNRYGIPERAFRITLQGISKAGTETFDRRAYGNFYEKVCTGTADRSPEEKSKELEKLYNLSQIAQKGFRWDEAVIGQEDLIFPPQNQLTYWRELSPKTKIETLPDMPHYPFDDPQVILSKLA